MAKDLLKSRLNKETIFLGVDADDYVSLIRKVADRLSGVEGVKDTKVLAEDAISREREMPTGIPHGIALPHARTRAVTQLVVAFCRPLKPLDFSSPDGVPADLVFLSAIPPDSIDEYLKMTAHLVRLLSHGDVADRLRSAETADDVLNALSLS